MKLVLISTYELGRQPFGLASPAAWLRRDGADVICLDLSRQRLDEDLIRTADVVAFYLPMHTATRLALVAAEKVRSINPSARLLAYGLYAPMNAGLLLSIGFESVIGGEFEEGLVEMVHRSSAPAAIFTDATKSISLARQRFIVPDRTSLPDLANYAQVILPDGARRVAGYTEASRGCKHLCRHCPIVPIYTGRFRLVEPSIVLADIAQQVGAGAEHITFGDPDFFNAARHAIGLVGALHKQHPNLTYDVTIKVEHLLKYSELLPNLRETGCILITTAVESVDDRVLDLLLKGHTRADFCDVVALSRRVGIHLAPTFVAFNPWITLEGYLDLLRTIMELELVEQIAPIQLSLRLLIPSGSHLLNLPEIRSLVDGFDKVSLSYRWNHPDPRVDELQKGVEEMVQRLVKSASRRAIFCDVWRLLHTASGIEAGCCVPVEDSLPSRAAIPFMNEPCYF